jgi:phage major head subunit gpT-like protein
MAVLTRADISRMLEAGQKKIFFDAFNSTPPQYPMYTTEMTSDKAQETYDSMGNLKAAELKAEGDDIKYGKVSQAYQTTIINYTYANGLEYTHEAIRDDLYGCVNDARATELARTMKVKEERTAIVGLDNAFTTALADGKALCANDHPCKDAPGQVNDTLTTGGLTTANLQTALNMFNDFKNHAGDPMDSDANKLITHKNNMFTVREILQSQNKANELSNTKNTLPMLQEVYLRYLTSTTAWFLEDTMFTHLIFQWRERTNFSADQDNIRTKDYYTNALGRWGNGAIPNIGIVGSAG